MGPDSNDEGSTGHSSTEVFHFSIPNDSVWSGISRRSSAGGLRTTSRQGPDDTISCPSIATPSCTPRLRSQYSIFQERTLAKHRHLTPKASPQRHHPYYSLPPEIPRERRDRRGAFGSKIASRGLCGSAPPRGKRYQSLSGNKGTSILRSKSDMPIR
jgi:hypothetical protein